MRVVIVHSRYRSENPSGENRVVERDIEPLRADGVEVIPYIRDSDEIDAFTPVGKAGLAVRRIVSPIDTLAFRRLLREVQPHIVHLHNPFPLISPWIVRTAKAQRVPVVQTVHNYRHVCVNGIHSRDGHLCTECVGKKVLWSAVQHGCYQGSRARSVPMAAALMAHRGTWDLVDRFLRLPVARRASPTEIQRLRSLPARQHRSRGHHGAGVDGQHIDDQPVDDDHKIRSLLPNNFHSGGGLINERPEFDEHDVKHRTMRLGLWSQF